MKSDIESNSSLMSGSKLINREPAPVPSSDNSKAKLDLGLEKRKCTFLFCGTERIFSDDLVPDMTPLLLITAYVGMLLIDMAARVTILYLRH